jgi:hypothetical protein
MKTNLTVVLLLGLFLGSATLLTACSQRTGDHAEEAAEESGEAVSSGAEDIGDAVEDAADDVDEEVDDAT